MTEEDNKLMDQYGITSKQKTVYLYKGHKYGNLKDALNFAKIDMKLK
ncbi:MAG: hypothetical protein KJO81_05185 [Gammaproteobacteria bacterium]|nr:hypothetical protein [Gammaproteobacteria bacterium]MBT8124200.1 hypothetical protein [Gammaproteobacteria bacterium]NNC66608.1 hypothetical protein [Gammaproteobacteria bacterium]